MSKFGEVQMDGVRLGDSGASGSRVAKIVFVALSTLFSVGTFAAVSGTAFIDYNGNGLLDTTGVAGTSSTAIDSGIGGLTVTATGVTGLGPDGVLGTADDLIGACGSPTTTSSAAATLGQYSIVTSACLPAAKVRIEFSGWPASVKPGLGAQTSVQFVANGATNINLPLVDGTKFCENNPQLATSCYVLGNQLTGPKASSDVVVSFPYSAGGTALPAGALPVPTHLAIASQVGATYGLAFQQATQRLFAASYLKYNSGFGPNGTGAIYTINKTTGAVSLFTDINDAAMTDAARPGLFGPGAAGIDPFIAGGTAPQSNGAKISWGDIDLSEDQKTLYALNMANLRVYAFPANGPVTTSSAVAVLPPLPFPAGAAGCTEPRVTSYDSYIGLTGPAAMGLGVKGNALYVGARCASIATGGGEFFVFKYDLTTNTWDAAPALRFNIAGTGFSVTQYSGLISDIAFDAAGNMILGVRVAASDYSNASSTGQLLRACPNGSGAFVLESAGTCGGQTGQATFGVPGPGGGQFFGPDVAADTLAHSQQGGIAVVPGNPIFATTSYDQFQLYDAGASWWNSTTGLNVKDYQVLVRPAPTAADPYNVKNGALGDLEAMCKAAPVEIGNRLWNDLNGDGIQDPNEPPLVGVTVELKSATGTVLATAVTDANGNYLFSNDPRGYPLAGNTGATNGGFVDDGQGGTVSTVASRYGVKFTSGDVVSVSIPNASGSAIQAPLAGLVLTRLTAGSNVAIDSNFAPNGTAAVAFVTVGAPGANDHTIDGGFTVPKIDLSVAKVTTSSGPYTAGTPVSYNLVASNNGPSNAQEQIRVSDCLPSGLNFVSASGTGWSCTNVAGPVVVGSLTCSTVVNCTRNVGTGVITPTTIISPIVVNATVAPGANGTLTNYTYVAPATNEPLPETNPLGTTNGGYESGSSTSGSNNDASAPVAALATYSVGNRVWLDTNNNGLIDGAEVGKDGVLVELLNAAGTSVVAVTTTAGGGYYRFDGLAAGDYKVRIAAGNFAATGALAGHASSTTTEANPNADVDNNDNGVDVAITALASSGVTSGVITLGPNAPEPVGETDLVGGAAAGNAAANGGADSTGNMTVDFGFVKLASLGNYVWYDANKNGVQDAGEVPASGVTVTLLDGAGAPVAGVAPIVTGANGLYLFDNLQPGSYSVQFSTIPAGYAFTTPLQGGAAGIDSDAVVATGKTAPVTLAAGDQNLTLDAGLVQLVGVSVGNFVWIDQNGNGIQDPLEPGVPGVTATISRVGGGAVTDVAGTPVATTATTDANGLYQFNILAPGQYTVTFSNLPAGYVITATNAAGSTTANDSNGLSSNSAILTYGQSDRTLDLGLKPLPVSVGNFVWIDTNSNGIQDAGEPGIPNVTVTITNADGSPAKDVNGAPVTGSTVTDVNGGYQFTNLAPGAYKVVFSGIPTGYVPTTTSATGSTPATDSNGLSSTTAVLVGGQSDQTVDLGLVQQTGVTVGNYVWVDTNGNGIQDASESGIAGVQATLSKVGGGAVTDILGNPISGAALIKTTDASGSYSFTNLAPGQYIVTFSGVPTGYSATTTNATGSNPTNDSNGLVATSSVLSVGQSDLTLDLGLKPPVTTFAIGNRVWLDTNNNGVIDAGEMGLAGIPVRLLNRAGTVVSSTSTTNGGYYLFSGVTAGSYQVEITPPSGYVSSSGTNGNASGPYEPGSADFTLAGDSKDHGSTQSSGVLRSATITVGPGLQPVGEAIDPATTDTTPDANTNLTVDFGLFAPAKLGNLVWLDNGQGGGVASDGKQNGTEAGVNGVTVKVYNAVGGLVATVMTTNNPITGTPGWYEVTNLISGQYQVEFAPPAGYVFTAQGPAAITSGSGIDTNTSQPTATNPRTPLVTLSPGDNNPQLDAGVVSTAAAPQPVPTLADWILMMLSGMMALIALRQRKLISIGRRR